MTAYSVQPHPPLNHSPAAAPWKRRALMLAVALALLAFLALATRTGLSAATDADGDGWSDDAEIFMGTDPNRACSATTDAGDEVLDAWPPDFNNDTRVDIADVVRLRSVYGSTEGDGVYSRRYDLNQDGRIDVADFVILRSAYGESCEPDTREGFIGEYYDNQDFTNLAFRRTDFKIDFQWGQGSPHPSMGTDNLSIRWTGEFTFAPAEYIFTARVDDGIRVWIDGAMVLNQWKDGAARTFTFSRTLEGGPHTIVVEYYENAGNAVVQFGWEPAVQPLIPAGTRIPWEDAEWYLHGANVPWYNWGCDFGCGSSGGASSSSVQQKLHEGFQKLNDAGIHVARWWTFPGDPWQITKDASGAPSGINPAVYDDFDAALALAEEYDLYYVFTLFSSPTRVPLDWMSDPVLRDRLATALGELFTHYGDHPRIITWQVFNEPEWHIWNGDVPLAPVQAAVRDIAAAVHEHTNAYVSVGSAHLGGLSYWKGLGLDYYTAHWYDGMSSGDACAMCTDYESVKAKYDLDAPLVIGEFYAGVADAEQRFQTWRDKGYAGAFAWSLFWDRTNDKMKIDLEAAAAFAAQHSDIGPTNTTPPATPTPSSTPTPDPGPTPTAAPPPAGFPTNPNLVYFAGDNKIDTVVSIMGQKFYINGAPTYQSRSWNGNLIEGLLLNSRKVNGIYDDLDGDPPSGMKPWDPRLNTEDYITNMPAWRSQGLVAINVNIQGGSNRCNNLSGDGQHAKVNNNPYGPGGTKAFDDWWANVDSPEARYLARLGSIIREADDLGMVVILGLFYFGQDEGLSGETAILAATDATVDWIMANGWRNVIIEVANESNHSAYNHSILKTSRVTELMERIRSRSGGKLPVSVSGTGGHVPSNDWIAASDFVLVHGNGQSTSGIKSMVGAVRNRSAWQAKPMPIVFNEDSTSLSNFKAAVEVYAAWGYHDNPGYQCVFSSNETDRWTLGKASNSDYWPLVAEMTEALP